MFGISGKQLIWLCQGLSTMLEAGLPVMRTLSVLGGQARPGRMRHVLNAARDRVEGGDSLAEALSASGSFPPLFLQLVATGEESGTLDRTLRELTHYYEFQRRLKLTFIAQSIMPVLQYVVAVAIVAVATYILHAIEGTSGNSGKILLVGYGGPVALVLAYYVLVKPLGATRLVHEALLGVPVISRVVRSLALARFSLIMHLMYEAGTPLRDALRRALEGTGNAAFAARARAAVATLEGGTLTEALQNTGLFPLEDLNIVAVAEESGKLSERLDWLAAHHAEQAEVGLRALVIVTARLIYVAVAAVIIFFIVKFFMRYASALQTAAGR